MRRLLLLLCLLPALASAQDYRFGVPEVDMTVRIQPDASVEVDYEFVFAPEPGSHAVDIVDIGMPNDDYTMKGMVGRGGGKLLTDVRVSQYVDPGVELHLHDATVPAGTEGTVGFHFEHEDLVFQDTTNSDLASFRITPTWFGGQYVVGNTDLKVAIVFPPGVEPDQVLHQGQKEFTSKATTGEGTTVLFHWPSTRFTSPHLVGVSFPKSAMDRVVTISRWELLVKAVEADSGTRAVLGLIAVALLAFVFFRFSGGTGFTVFLPLLALLVFVSMASAGFQILAIPIGVVVLILNETVLKKRKGKYLPPIAEIEGGGIKRGLTAPEAAIVLEEPLPKVLTLVVFGLLKKGVFVPAEGKGMVVEVAEPFLLRRTKPKRKEAERKIAARKAGVALRPYEEEFIQVVEQAPKGTALGDLDFSDPLKGMVAATADRMSGFDLSDTRDYYRKIIDRALTEASEEVTVESGREERLDRNLEWLVLHEAGGGLFDRYHYRPPWHRRGHYHHHGGGGGGISLPGGGGDKGGNPGWSPTLGDAAAGYAGWAENAMGSLADTILPGSVGKSGGVLDLSGVDRVTGDILEAMAEASANSSGGGGGGGGGCACACAGCACACACAGGGR